MVDFFKTVRVEGRVRLGGVFDRRLFGVFDRRLFGVVVRPCLALVSAWTFSFSMDRVTGDAIGLAFGLVFGLALGLALGLPPPNLLSLCVCGVSESL